MYYYSYYSAEAALLLLAILRLIMYLKTVKAQDQNCTEGKTYNSCCSGCGYAFNTAKETLVEAIEDFFLDVSAGRNKYGEMNCWDVSKIKDMSGLFSPNYIMNEPIECWDIGNVTNMHGMFGFAVSFNQPLDKWDTSKVTNMESVFYNATSFNQPLNSWNVSSVKTMTWLFSRADSFNQPLDNWDTSKVKKAMATFQLAKSFNQPLDAWDVSSVTDMAYMFLGAASFDQPLSSWKVAKVITMKSMFSATKVFNQPLNSWDVSSVTDMSNMFYDSTLFNQPLSNWNVSQVITMSSMFDDSKVFNQPLNNWDVSSVTDMKNMFDGARNFDQNLCAWYNKSCQVKADFSNMFHLTLCTFTSDPDCDSNATFPSFCVTCPKASFTILKRTIILLFFLLVLFTFLLAFDNFRCINKIFQVEYSNTDNPVPTNISTGNPVHPNNLGVILGLSLGLAIAAVVSILFVLLYKKRDAQNSTGDNGVENMQNQTNDVQTQKDSRISSQNVDNATKATFNELAREARPYIEVDHAVDNVSTLGDLHDIDLPSEEIFDDRTVGFSTIEFCTVYEAHLHGNDIYHIQKPSSTVVKKSDHRDFESAYTPEPPLENCTPVIAESQLCGTSMDVAGTSGINRVNKFAISDEGVETSPPQLSDFTGRLQERRLAYTLPEKKSSSTTSKSQVISHAPPGELGLTIIRDSKTGLVQVHQIKFSSPLRGFIQEGDVLESLDGEYTAGLTCSQASSLISSRAGNTTRALVFTRDVDKSCNVTAEESFEGATVIVYAPPGELGLTFDSGTKNGQVIVRCVKACSPLYSKIQEGDVLKCVDGISTAELTATKALGLISSRASNSLRSLAFHRNAESEV